MRYTLLGINHKTAPVEVRERLAISESHLPEAMLRLVAHPGVAEAVIFSTCNRVELFARATSSVPDLHSFLREYFQVDSNALSAHLYQYSDREAVRHLFRVAASLDSMIVGEPQ